MPDDHTPPPKPGPPKPGPPKPGPPSRIAPRPRPTSSGRSSAAGSGRQDERPPAPGGTQRPRAQSGRTQTPPRPVATTAPYTFVPFGPTVAARTLTGADLADPAGAPVAASAFDRPLPTTYNGYIDLTITALSPLFIGGDPDGASFHWPGTTPGVAGIPGSSLHGMLRGTLAHILGGGIGPVPDRRIFYRSPIAPKRDVSNPLHDHYKTRNPGGVVGGQRIGLLYRDGGRFLIKECVQFTGRGRSNVVPRVRWTVLEADLGLQREGSRPGRRADVFHLQWRRMWVVWAAVGAPGERDTKPVVVGVGTSADTATSAASHRRGNDRIHQSLPPGNRSTFRHFLGPTGERSDEPQPVQMVFTATGLEGLTSIASAYLFPIPGSDVEYLIDAHDRFVDTDGPLEVARSAVGDLLAGDQPSRYQIDNWPPAKDFLFPKPDGPDGIPVFYTPPGSDGVVRLLGRSGGFRIPATRTVLDTVPTEHRTPDSEVPALHALFGHQPVGDDDTVPAMAGRIEVGHARAIADPGTLPTATVTLLEPKAAAWKFRLTRPDRALQTGYDDPDAVYRGREVYHHRWPTGAVDDAEVWREMTEQRTTETAADDQPPPIDENPERVSGPKTPLRSGARFTARIRFTNLAQPELGALLFAIRLGNERGPTGLSQHFAHRVGGMKPMGLGSIHLDASTSLICADRYQSWGAPAVTPLEDEDACIDTFIEAINAADHHINTDWVWVPETNRHWPEHIAALLLSARWAKRRPLADTRPMTLEDHASATNLPDILALHPDARRYPDH